MKPEFRTIRRVATLSSLRLVVNNPPPDQEKAAGPMKEIVRAAYDTEYLATCLLAVGARQDRQAFRTLFDYFAPRITAYIMKSGSSSQQAEELAQETMVKVWRKAALFDPEKAAPSTWIFRIARNHRVDLFRKENRPELNAHDPLLQPEPAQEPDAILQKKQEADQLRQFLHDLPEEQLVLLRLSFFHDMSHRDIADHLLLPLGTVKSRIRLAMGNLRKRLQDHLDKTGNKRDTG